MTEIRRDWAGKVLLRAAGDPDERILEGIVVPYDQVATVRDSPQGRPYRETIARGAMDGLDWSSVLLEYIPDSGSKDHNTHAGARLIGRGIGGDVNRADGAFGQFRVSRTPLGDEAYELARDGILTDLSINATPVAERRRSGGVVERTKIDVRRVAVVAQGAYSGAQITAVRAAQEGDMPEDSTTAPAATEDQEEDEDETPAPKGRPNRTRVTVDVDRAAAERSAVANLSRQGSDRPRIQVTRPEQIYRNDATWSGVDDRGQRYSLLSDGWKARNGDSAAAERFYRHQAMLDEFERKAADAAEVVWGSDQFARAGDVISSELGGAIPNQYIPGLFTPQLAKGRPMGGFYDTFPIADATPKIFPKTSTSTSTAVQGAEGANPAASDFATTAVSTTPALYGARTDVSRQVLDGANPAAEAMLMQDLLEGYAQATELVIATAVEAGSGASGTAITAATPYVGTLGNVVKYATTRFAAAQGQFVPAALFGVLVTQLSAGDGRPLLPVIGPTNADGTLNSDNLGYVLANAQGAMSYQSTVNVVVTARRTDFVIFESPVARFSYDQVVGPAAVRVGVWAYLGIGVRLGSLKVTAA